MPDQGSRVELSIPLNSIEVRDQASSQMSLPPSLATAPAIINAIYNVLGVPVTSLPEDKMRVLQALKEKRELKYLCRP